MARTRLEFPEGFASRAFTCSIPVRITDINYGNHVGNDSILSLLHEARMQYLHQFGYTELQFAGTGLIMSDVTIEFKSELHYGDTVFASVATAECGKVGFELYYKLEKETDGKRVTVVNACTTMICFDYGKKKITPLPDEAKAKFGQ